MGDKMKKTKFLDRLITFFYWNYMTLGWFLGIFSSKVYSSNEDWLIEYSKKYSKKFK